MFCYSISGEDGKGFGHMSVLEFLLNLLKASRRTVNKFNVLSFGVVKESGGTEEEIDCCLEDVEGRGVKNSTFKTHNDVLTELVPKTKQSTSGKTYTEGV